MDPIVDEIKAIGDDVRKLKPANADKAESASTAAADPVNAPVTTANTSQSKNAAKKAEKAAKKAAGKGAKLMPPAGSGSSTLAAVAGDARSAPPLKTAVSSPASMFLSGDGPGPLKCAAAARFYEVEVEAANTNPAGDLSFASGCVLAAGDSLIFGPNAICRYFSYKGASSVGVGSVGRGVVEDWLEWEAVTLAPAERMILSTALSSDPSPPEALAALVHLEENLAGDWLLEGDKPSLSDLVVGTTTRAAFSQLKDAEVSSFPRIEAYVKRLEGFDAFAQAAAGVDEFIKAARGVDIKPGLQASLMAIFDAAMFKAWPLAKGSGVTSSGVVKCFNYKFGDFQCNAAMSLYKALKGTREGPSSPMKAAAAIVAAVPPCPLIEHMSVAPGGFINIRLRPAFINKGIADIIKNGPTPPEMKPSRVVVDFSSPNIAKEMHVGHLRSTIIGDVICRVLEFCGHMVFRHNHVGDWGTQFGMLINYMREAYPNFLTEPPNITDLTTFYKAAKLRFDESEEFKEASRNTVVDLQSGDPGCKEVWTLLCQISRKEFQKVYDRLGVKLEEHGESFYNEMIPSTIDALASAGLVCKDDGADIVRLDHFTYPLIVRKRDGGYGYDSTDMAAIRYRLKTLKCDWLIYITDAGQAGHFEMCFDAARAAGWPKEDTRLQHLGFGVVQGEDGKKFKTRSGETVRLVDLLDEAVRRMRATIQERMDAGKVTTTQEAALASATEMGYGAVKYFDLRQHPTTSYVFSYDRMLDTRGNTAVYLQFAHARLASILRKAKDELNVDLNVLKASPDQVSVEHDAERALAFELLVFSDVIEACISDLGPNRLCDYLYILATKFTDFVTNCRVLGSDEQRSRLLLCEATGVTMRTCFSLLGMKALDRI